MLRFMTDDEYRSYWSNLGETREAIAKDVARHEGSLTIDVACGYGYYTHKLSLNDPTGNIVAVDIVPSAFVNMRKLASHLDFAHIEPLMADSSLLPMRSEIFHLTTSFLGMRDIYMTRGKGGVESTIREMIKTSKRTGRIALAVTPPDLAEDTAVRVAIDAEGEIFGAKSLPFSFYTGLLRENGVDRPKRKTYSTGLKMTAEQAKVELKEGIEIARTIYGRDVEGFDEVWKRFGPIIERHGYGMYSEITVVSGTKT